jgi:hypothetical protein
MMVSVYFSRRGLVSLEFLPDGKTLDSAFFVDEILASIVRSFALTRPKMRPRGVHLHFDDANAIRRNDPFRRSKNWDSSRCSSHPTHPTTQNTQCPAFRSVLIEFF